MDGLLIIPILAILIIVHELGHFWAARSVGVKVEEFGIGIPPRAKGWERNGVIWSLNWIPFGGFVRVKGEDAADTSTDSMNSKPPLQRAFFLAAGSAMNLLLAVALIFVLLGVQGELQNRVYADGVVEAGPAAQAGLQPGDEIIRANGDRIDSTDELISITNSNRGQEVDLTILRAGEEIQISFVPREDPPVGEGPAGVALPQNVYQAEIGIDSVTAGSPAATAGLQAGDEILAIDGVAVDDNYLPSYLLADSQGETVILTVNRDGQQQDIALAVPVRGIELDQIALDTPADQAGWLQGDTIIAVNNQPITDAEVLLDAFESNSGGSVSVLVERAEPLPAPFVGNRVATTLQIPALAEDADFLDEIGIDAALPAISQTVGFEQAIDPNYEPVPFAQILPTGLAQAWETTRLMVDGLITLFTGGADLGQIAGPVGMGQLVGDSLDASPLPAWVVVVQISIVLSLNLAILNLLPFPALDGGRLFFVLIEILRGGKKIAPEREGLFHFAGLVLLLGVMFVVAFNDVRRIFSGDSFFQ